MVGARTRNTNPGIPNPKYKSHNPELEIQTPESQTRNSTPRIPNSKNKPQILEPKTKAPNWKYLENRIQNLNPDNPNSKVNVNLNWPKNLWSPIPAKLTSSWKIANLLSYRFFEFE